MQDLVEKTCDGLLFMVVTGFWSAAFLEKVIKISDQLFTEKMRATGSGITQDWFLNSVIPKNIYKY